MSKAAESEHPFLTSPHRTFFLLAVPVLFSLIAEPLTGLVDTAFVARLGASSLAALGVGTTILSSIFWIFNFLSIGTQTEVSQSRGRGELQVGIRVSGMAIIMSLAFGVLLTILLIIFSPPVATLMGAEREIHEQAVQYIRLRSFGAPAVLLTITSFGILYGLQDMRTPLVIAVAVNVLNIILDALLVFGIGPFPSLGIGGAALASTISQWIGGLSVCLMVYQRVGLPEHLLFRDIRKILNIGGQLFVRTGLLTLFLVLTTRMATRIGADAGAAHQAIRQVWVFTALFLDASAITAQSLIGYFFGSGRIEFARRVARVVCFWAIVAGIMLAAIMLIGESIAAVAFVPPSAWKIFKPAWIVASITQPICALSFVTDGIHWGTGDFKFLKNVVVLATACGTIGLFLLDPNHPGALTRIWMITAGWVSIRALFGMLRIWPGIGYSPLKAIRGAE